MKNKIAIPVDDNGILDSHFGHCKFFLLLYVENNEVTYEEKVVPPPHEPGLLPKWIAEQGVSDIIAGGMGQRAINLFNQHGVKVHVGAPRKNAMELVESYLNNTLSFETNHCSH